MNDLSDDEVAIGFRESQIESAVRRIDRTEEIRRSNERWAKWLNRVVILGGSITGLALISWLVK